MLDASRRRRAVEALGAMGGTEAVRSLTRALEDPEPDVRARAAELLAELDAVEAHDDLERTAYDPISSVAEAARRALTRLRPTPELAAIS